MLDDTVEICSPYPPAAADGRRLVFDPRWRTEAVSALARGIDAESALDRLPILADALEEAGCDLPAVLHHCRTCRHASCSCWVVNLALGRVPADPSRWPLLDVELAERLRRAAEQRAAWANARPPADPPLGLRHLLVVSCAGALVGLSYLLGGATPSRQAEQAPPTGSATPDPWPGFNDRFNSPQGTQDKP